MIPAALLEGAGLPDAVRGRLGQPGVYFVPDLPPPTLSVEPMDVAAFAGVAPRGPAFEPIEGSELGRARSVAVPVTSWDDYVEHFGAFEAPGLLPHAVAAYFAQGGRRAYVVRVVHSDGDSPHAAVPPGCATYRLTTSSGDLVVRSRNQGSWGSRLSFHLSFLTRPVAVVAAAGAELFLEPGSGVHTGSLLRVRGAGAAPALRWVTGVERRGRITDSGHDLVATLSGPPGFAIDAAEQVEGELEVHDPGSTAQPRGRRDLLTNLGLAVAHPRWIGSVVRSESRLADFVEGDPELVPDVTLAPIAGQRTSEGADLWDHVVPQDFLGRLLVGDDSGTEGLDALLNVPEVATVVAPDLYSPRPPDAGELPPDPGSMSGPAFHPCVHAATPPEPQPVGPGLDGLYLDPRDPTDLARIVSVQQELVRIAQRLDCVALLDVPPGLRHAAVLRWRAQFDSSYAACYHPWLRVLDPSRDRLIEINPSAVAAALMARSERRSGVPRGPANELAAGVGGLSEEIGDPRHAELHVSGVNVYRMRPDGVWLTGARTLSSEREWRQLSVRRILLLIERAVRRQLQWTVFEPNDHGLRAGLKQMVEHLLGRLFDQGAFAGATARDSWFIHVTGGAELRREADLGQVVVEVGVAPAEPTEYIVVKVVLDAAGKTTTTFGTVAGGPARG